jgi:type VI secretion system protein ImpC
VEVTEREGMIGWYDCSIAILPHIQFEGMDVELRLDARL